MARRAASGLRLTMINGIREMPVNSEQSTWPHYGLAVQLQSAATGWNRESWDD
jgi:hypothetical protein